MSSFIPFDFIPKDTILAMRDFVRNATVQIVHDEALTFRKALAVQEAEDNGD